MNNVLNDDTIKAIIYEVLNRTKVFCASRDSCEGCPYMIMPAPGKSFATCALSGRPEHWRIEIFGGEKNGLSDANNTEDQ